MEGTRAKKRQVYRGRRRNWRSSLKFDVKTFLSLVGSGTNYREIQAEEDHLSARLSADAVFYIQSGKIELSVVSREGKERVIAILGAGDFFGEGCSAGQPLHMASAIALAELNDLEN